MTQRTTSRGGLFKGMDYRQAVDLVDSSPGASRELRRRIAEDQHRDLLASVRDAQLLCSLQRLRVDTIVNGKRRVERH